MKEALFFGITKQLFKAARKLPWFGFFSPLKSNCFVIINMPLLSFFY